MGRRRVFVVAGLVWLAVAAPAEGAVTRVVDDDRAQCSDAQYLTIQAAVDAAGQGDTVVVCDGVYREQVVVPPFKDALRLRAKVVQGAVIRSTNPITVDRAQLVRIERFVLEGDGSGAGVGISLRPARDAQSASTELIDQNLIRRVGTGIRVDNTFAGEVRDNTIQEYGQYGVHLVGVDRLIGVARARLLRNTLIGTPDSTGVLAEQGPEGAAGANVLGNRILGNSGAGAGVRAGAGTYLVVESNNVLGNGVGIRLDGAGSHRVARNRVHSNEREGILAGATTFAGQFSGNDARGNGGVDCDDQSPAAQNQWAGNFGIESSKPGLCSPGPRGRGPAPNADVQIVDDDGAECPLAQHTTIQAGVDAAADGDTVLVCDGLYREGVTITEEPPGFKSLRVIANVAQGAIVRSPNPFTIGENVRVEISRFVIEGDGPGTGVGIGILTPFASATALQGNLIRRVGTGIDLNDASGGEIRGNTIQEFEADGIDAHSGSGQSLGAFADVRSNTIVGSPGSTGVVFSQGRFGSFIQISGRILGNRILGNSDGGVGVRVDHALVTVESNRVYAGGTGIAVSATDGLSVSRNVVNSNEQQGIRLDEAGNMRLWSNNALGNGGLDCEDLSAPGGTGTAGTENLWIDNLGIDAAPPGICKPRAP